MIDLPVDFDKLKITSTEPPVNLQEIKCKLPISINPFCGDNINRFDVNSEAQKKNFHSYKAKQNDVSSLEGCQLCCFNRCKESMLKKTKFQQIQDPSYQSPDKQCSSKALKSVSYQSVRNYKKQRIWNHKPILRPIRNCSYSYRKPHQNFHKNKMRSSKKHHEKKASKLLSDKEVSNAIGLDAKCFIKPRVYNVSPYICTNIKPINRTSNQFQRPCNVHAENALSSLENTIFRFTPCSQQAGNRTTNDDITIDELASYFDTLVHIPKKMSSMAEMMYI